LLDEASNRAALEITEKYNSMAYSGDNSTNHEDSRDHSAERLIRRLGARYLLVLALVALLMVVDQAVVQPLLVRLDAYAPAINLAGRQRMLSQKLTKAAIGFQHSGDEGTRRAYLAEVRETLTQWSAAHDVLLNKGKYLGIRTITSPQIEAEWNALQPHFNVMCSAAARLIDHAESHGDANIASQAVIQIATHESSFLMAMDRIVNLMESKAAHEILRLRACALAIAGAVMVLLVGLGWLVVRPATRTIRQQVDDLESRIAQRTRELADALASLCRQHAERESMELKNKALAARINHADRVASMGHLTIGLAHELNQPLGAISNYAEACDVLLSHHSEMHEHLRLQGNVSQIKQASLRAGQIVRRIRNFIQPRPGTIEDVDINALVQEVVALCRQELVQAKVELVLDLAAGDSIVAVDSIQIQQVLVNLLQNALQAMQSCPSDERRLTLRTSHSLETARVDIIDSGHGFAAADAEAIFEPFHTTKNEGLGIGLAICRSIIGSHTGTIWAESNFANGAQVSFTLPLSQLHEARRTIKSNCLCG
jgi:two-component system, LuxR family, sensor kinase FixL